LDKLFFETGKCCDIVPSLALKYGYEKLSVCLQRSVARQILSRSDSTLHNSLVLDSTLEPSIIPFKTPCLDGVVSPILDVVAVPPSMPSVEDVVKNVIDRLPLKVVEVVPPLVSKVSNNLSLLADDIDAKIIRLKSPVRPVKGSLIDVKYDRIGWCKGIVKRVYGVDTVRVYFDCDHTEPTLNLKKVKWRWR